MLGIDIVFYYVAISIGYKSLLTNGHHNSSVHHNRSLLPYGDIKVNQIFLVGHELATRDAVNCHPRMVLKVVQEFRGDEEILARILLACYLHHTLMYHSFVSRIHALVYLIDDSERCSRQ